MLVLLLVESDLKRKWDTRAILIVLTQLSDPGPPRPIFGRQGLHNGGHINGVPPLPPPLSNLQNPCKAQALGALPAVAALETIKSRTVAHYQLTGLACLFDTQIQKGFNSNSRVLGLWFKTILWLNWIKLRFQKDFGSHCFPGSLLAFGRRNRLKGGTKSKCKWYLIIIRLQLPTLHNFQRHHQ